MTSGELAENRNMILIVARFPRHIIVQGWALPQLGLLRPFHPWYRYSGDHLLSFSVHLFFFLLLLNSNLYFVYLPMALCPVLTLDFP